ncbi:extensin [Streptomyces stramineus]|uniref:extensin n=1 Tax=Streptomyces stramineus TaxID=173861 RepID=UPI0031E2A3C8
MPTPSPLPHAPGAVTARRAPHSATGALAAVAAATVAVALPRVRPPGRPAAASGPPPSSEPSPPYAPRPSHEPLPSYEPTAREQPPGNQPPPAYTGPPAGGFDPRALSDFQLDELVHRIIGRVTRLIRTELRLDRERIGRLRDPRL